MTTFDFFENTKYYSRRYIAREMRGAAPRVIKWRLRRVLPQVLVDIILGYENSANEEAKNKVVAELLAFRDVYHWMFREKLVHFRSNNSIVIVAKAMIGRYTGKIVGRFEAPIDSMTLEEVKRDSPLIAKSHFLQQQDRRANPKKKKSVFEAKYDRSSIIASDYVEPHYWRKTRYEEWNAALESGLEIDNYVGRVALGAHLHEDFYVNTFVEEEDSDGDGIVVGDIYSDDDDPDNANFLLDTATDLTQAVAESLELLQ